VRPLAKKTASLIKERNFEKQIFDFGMRILDLRNSVYFKLIERSDSIIRQSSIDIRHSNVVSQEGTAKNGPVKVKTMVTIRDQEITDNRQ